MGKWYFCCHGLVFLLSVVHTQVNSGAEESKALPSGGGVGPLGVGVLLSVQLAYKMVKIGGSFLPYPDHCHVMGL